MRKIGSCVVLALLCLNAVFAQKKNLTRKVRYMNDQFFTALLVIGEKKWLHSHRKRWVLKLNIFEEFQNCGSDTFVFTSLIITYWGQLNETFD